MPVALLIFYLVLLYLNVRAIPAIKDATFPELSEIERDMSLEEIESAHKMAAGFMTLINLLTILACYLTFKMTALSGKIAAVGLGVSALTSLAVNSQAIELSMNNPGGKMPGWLVWYTRIQLPLELLCLLVLAGNMVVMAI